MPSHLRFAVAVSSAALLVCQPLFAFDSPLSEEAVREAYFLGQRHDDSLAIALAKYKKSLPIPEIGPHIASVTFFTPFALLVQSSSQHISYSAQQAALDHRSQKETVQIIVEIRFTESYGAYIVRPTSSSSGAPKGFAFRPYNFWKDFDVQAFAADDKEVLPFSSHGEPNVLCADDGSCTLTGATVTLVFPAEAFPSDSATVSITPPEGDPVSVDFDLSSFR
jgi:hypothetical protein